MTRRRASSRFFSRGICVPFLLLVCVPEAELFSQSTIPTLADLYANSRSVVDLSLPELRKAYPAELGSIQFVEDQSGLASLLQEAGEAVMLFFRDLPNTSAREQVRLERLRSDGRVEDSLRQSFNYVAELKIVEGNIFMEEFRTDEKGRPLRSNRMNGPSSLTFGFTATNMVFHPRYQAYSRFRYLGRQSPEPGAAHLIAFAQIAETGVYIGSFQLEGREAAPVFLQGIAWVDPGNHQILRLRTDLLIPRIDLGLNRQTSELWYSEVRFSDIPHSFWLPREVVVNVECMGIRMRNRHQYSDYVVFVVESRDKLEAPKIKKIP